MGILFRELGHYYEGALRGEAVELAELPIQYVDYAVWQRDRLQGAVLEEQLGYWRGQLATAPEVLELPTDYPRPAAQTGVQNASLYVPRPAAAAHTGVRTAALHLPLATPRFTKAENPTSMIPAQSDAALSQAMALEGVPGSWQQGLRFIMAQESGGRVDLKNPVHSARGLHTFPWGGQVHNVAARDSAGMPRRDPIVRIEVPRRR